MTTHSVCGAKARCTACRVIMTRGLVAFGPPSGLEAKALAGIDARPQMRSACQRRRTADRAGLLVLPAR